jgi:C4-dicarboxylate transporter DctM subunit
MIMSDMAQFVLVIGVFLTLLLAGMWIPFAIFVAASLYIVLFAGWDGLNAYGLVSWGSMNSFTLTAIPLFILMAEIMLESGLSQRVYRGMARIVRPLPGGLLQTNIAGCAAFSAISGSSVATAAAIGSVALPQLEQRGYCKKLSTGTLAAGGTLGILIPPSIAMIIYGTFTETSIAKLFMAGVVPGLALVGLFMGYVALRCLINPRLAPRVDNANPPPLRQTLADLLPFAALIIGVMSSLYAGLATPTEAAGVGACMAAVIARIWGEFSLDTLRRALNRTVKSCGAILFIVYAAFLFSYAIAMAGLTDGISDLLREWDLSVTQLLITIVILYTVLGFLMDSIGMMVITVPILHPILLNYGVDPVWFGVLLVVLIELGQVTPPVGMNLFVVKSVAPTAELRDVILGSLPFCLLMYVLIAWLIYSPQLALWFPGRMSG